MALSDITLVLLPGLHGTQALFDPFVSTKIERVCIKAINYPTDEVKTYSQLMSLTFDQINCIKTPIVLLGESFSGPLALLIATKKIKKLIGVILVGTFVEAPNIRLGQYLPWTIIFTMTNLAGRVLAGLHYKYSKSLLFFVLSEVKKSRASVLAARIKLAYEVDARDVLKQCPVPIMYFRGNRDYLVPKKNLKQIQAIRPDVQVVFFDTSHAILQVLPVQAWEAVAQFLKKQQ